MECVDEDAITIFVDGSSKPTPRLGGVGVIVVWVDSDGNQKTHEESLLFSYEGATNNRMEIQAIIEALKIIVGRHSPVDSERFRRIVIYTDSLYVYENFPNAIHVWPSRGWMTRQDSPVLNVPRWKELRKLVKGLWDQRRMKVDVKWVKGKRSAYTKRVDKLAKTSADSPIRKKQDHARVRRKWSPNSVQQGCVSMRGQEEIIRIVMDEFLPSHKVYRYMYEVIDRRSADYQKVDYVFSKTLLSAGHLYRVEFNDYMGFPRIQRMLTEFPRDEYTHKDYVRGSPGPWED